MFKNRKIKIFQEQGINLAHGKTIPYYATKYWQISLIIY